MSTPAITSASDRRAFLASICSLAVITVYSASVMGPLLTSISDEFGVSVGTAGLGASLYGLVAIPLGLVIGPFTDRLGRKPFLLGGAILIGVFGLASAAAPTFPLMVAARTLAGFGGSMIFGMLHASVGDAFPYKERGRAQSLVVLVNQMVPIIGVPIAGIIAEALSWRLSIAVPSACALIVATVLWRRLPRLTPASTAGHRAIYGQALGSPAVRRALLAFTLTQISWFSWLIYLVVFIQRTYGLTPAAAATVAIASGVGVATGSVLGGRLGDRLGNRQVALPASLALVVMFVVVTSLSMPLWLGAISIIGLSLLISVRYVTMAVLFVGQAPTARGTIGSLMSSAQGIGIAGGAFVGGLFVDRLGFPAFGAFLAVVCLVGALAIARVHDVVEERELPVPV